MCVVNGEHSTFDGATNSVSVVTLGVEAAEYAKRMEVAKHRALSSAAQLCPDPRVKQLIPQLYHHVAPDMVNHRDPRTIAEVASSLVAFAQQRNAGEAKVRVSDMPGIAGTVIEICTDDMPFLVDSLTARLNLDLHSILVVIHPQMLVRRDGQGVLIDVVESGDELDDVTDFIAESWMHIEVTRIKNSDDQDACAESLLRILRDVRVAVRDWIPMRDQALVLADELAATRPASVGAEELDESIELLRWLTDDNFTFLGYREYRLVGEVGDEALEVVDGTGLGILEGQQSHSKAFAALPAAARVHAREPHVLVITKANRKSTVHRPAFLDYIGVKSFDVNGVVIGERRFLGLWTSTVYTQGVEEIPILRHRVEQVMADSGYLPQSHSARDLRLFLETYPRDELFQITVPELAEVANDVMHLQERRQTKLFMRRDIYDRFMSCLVYLPRDRYTTKVRTRIESALLEALDGESIEFTVRVSESVLARLHFVVHIRHGHEIPKIDYRALEQQLASATRSWQDDFAALAEVHHSTHWTRAFNDAFPEAYKESFDPEVGIADAQIIESVPSGGFALRFDDGEHFKIYRVGEHISLSEVLPVLVSLGVEVEDERPFHLERPEQPSAWIYDFGLRLPAGVDASEATRERFAQAFAACWTGEAEADPLGGLVLSAGLTWQNVVLLRSIVRYLRQIGTPYSQTYIEQVLLANSELSAKLFAYFAARFDPDTHSAEQAEVLAGEISAGLDAVLSLDHDRILRAIFGVISATLRTNYYQDDTDALVLKLDPHRIVDLPPPTPRFEMWVYSPRVEGVHLRFGHVARGGLRWSDRREDFRTEILGLVKAQEVKNAVIVPVGAKGGFYAKQLPDPAVDREAWLNEGIGSYQVFIRSMLDVTDNLVGGDVVPPLRTVRHDGDDPYLVVAADKGTATFSDIANAIALERGFWLGDAFASGGSEGYDHKAMGITARGAWVSVQRHFRELSKDVQAEDFTVVGIGDMSGDVFGNGMLLSEHIRLVAAFDHRHIFIDPNPDSARSFIERQRLFALPRSSWADYDVSLISAGGGVFPRAAKSIELNDEIRTALGIDAGVAALTPNELISAILVAPVELLWNGGIGTYVKSVHESNADVGDKANDSIRVNGSQLRCLVVGEGGNLGFTQLGRVEAAMCGVKLNTDAIDNSAGVDTSDHEVNIKILVDSLIADGTISASERHDLLMSMTDEVAELVLDDNYGQNVTLGNSRAGALDMATVHMRMMDALSARGLLNRQLEFLPTDEELADRVARGYGLSSPELCVLLAYSKISLMSDLRGTQLALDPWYDRFLHAYFPTQLQQYGAAMDRHRLREEIVETAVANWLINTGGITFVFRAMEETGATSLEVVKAATVAANVFDHDTVWWAINDLDGQVSTTTQNALHLESRRLLDRVTRWFLNTRGGSIDVTAEIERFKPQVQLLSAAVSQSLMGVELDRFEANVAEYVGQGVPVELARIVAAELDQFSLLDIIEIANRADVDAKFVRDLYFAVSERFDIDVMLRRISGLPRNDRWSALARHAMRADLYATAAGLTNRVLRSSTSGTPIERLAAWESSRPEGLARASATLDEIVSKPTSDLASISVALRALRTLVTQQA